MGADIHAQGDHALRLSTYNGHLPVVKLLIEMGADYKKHFHDFYEDIKIWVLKYIISIKRIQRWILKIFSKPYYKDESIGFLASGWEEIQKNEKLKI